MALSLLIGIFTAEQSLKVMYCSEDLDRFISNIRQRRSLMVSPFSHFALAISCLTISFQNGIGLPAANDPQNLP